MEQLPDSIKAILDGDPIRDRVCCNTCGRHDVDPTWMPSRKLNRLRGSINDSSLYKCSICDTSYFCSEKCYTVGYAGHSAICSVLAEQRNSNQFIYPTWIFQKMKHADTFLRIGYQQKQLCLPGSLRCPNYQNYQYYYRKALGVYLDCTLQSRTLNEDLKAKVHDRTVLLLVILGGDAQVMLDFFAFLSSLEPETQSSIETPNPLLPTTTESKAQRQHPLLALHGFFDGESNPRDYTISALYLLAIFRSLVQHRQIKSSFEAYKEAIENPSSRLPSKVEAVHDTITSFLWSKHGHSYGEALADELRRVIRHIQEKKENGTLFLRYLLPSSGTLSCEVAPQFMASELGPDNNENSNGAPDFWSLYQDCFLSLTRESSWSSVSLAEFLPELSLVDGGGGKNKVD